MITPNHIYRTDRNSTYTVSYSVPTGTPPPNGSGPVGSCITSYDALSINSTNTPGFHRLKKSQRPFHAYSKSHIKYTDGPCTMTQSYRAKSGGLVGNFTYNNFNVYLNGGYAFRFSVPADDAYQKLVARIQDDIRLGKTDLGVTLAEAHKTAAMIATTATRLASAIRALRRGDLGDFSKSLGITTSRKQRQRYYNRKRLVWDPRHRSRYLKNKKEVYFATKEKFARDTWLEYTYGWMPLLSDVYSSAKALASLTVDPSKAVRTVRARTTVSSFRERTDFLRNVKVTTNMKTTTYGDMVVNYTIPNGISFGDAMGLNNPLTIAWELIPFSFVVDWFLPIGQSIQALTAYNGLSFVSGSYQRRVVVNEKVTCSPGKTWDAGSEVWGPQNINCSLDLESVNMTRSFLGSFPSYGWPAFKNPLSVKHMISSLALLSSAFRK